MLRRVLWEEEQTRITALMDEKQQKSETMRRKNEALSREIEAISDKIRGTKEVLRAVDILFLQNYNTAAELVRCFQVNDRQPIPGALIDMEKHLKNMHVNILEKMKKVYLSLNPQTAPESTVLPMEGTLHRLRTRDPQTANLEPTVGVLRESLARLRAGERQSYCALQSRASVMPPSRAFGVRGYPFTWSSVSTSNSNTRMSYARPNTGSRSANSNLPPYN